MATSDLTFLYAYSRWANDRTITAVEALSDEQLHRDLKSSFPSVFATLVHMLGADWIWLERWKGSSPSTWPDSDNLKTLADLRARWKGIEDGQRDFIASLDHPALERRFHYKNMKGDAFNDGLGLTLRHVVNHATYHRGQIGTMMRQLGAKPAGTDFITFAREAV